MQEPRRFAVDWNGETRFLEIPQSNLNTEIIMTDFPPLADPWQSIVNSLESPIGCDPLPEMLKPRSKVVLITGDRFTDLMLGSRDGLGLKLLDYLNHLGVRDEDVTLVYAPGSHDSPSWKEKIGPELMDRVRTIRHDCFDEKSLTYLGATSRSTPVWVNTEVVEADFRLGIGEISPNVHGGWCGGGKMILPGVAGWDTIQQNHYMVVNEVNTLGLADGNHMRLDMEEAARMAHLDMKVDVLVDSNPQIVDVYAGDFVKEHRAALDGKAREIWMTDMAPADIYVFYPGDGSEQYLTSSFFIRIEAAEIGTKEDGVIIMALSAAGGWAPDQKGKHSTGDTEELFKEGTPEIARAMVRKEVNIRTWSMLYTARRVLERRKVILVCDGIDPEQAKELGFEYCTPSFDDAMARALEMKSDDSTIAVNLVPRPTASTNVAWRKMPWRQG